MLIIEYINRIQLDFANAHDDYVELFLFKTKISLPRILHFCIDRQSLESVTYYFTRYKTPNNCEKPATLYISSVNEIYKYIKYYFSYTCVRHIFNIYTLNKICQKELYLLWNTMIRRAKEKINKDKNFKEKSNDFSSYHN